jgi:hypothetical protein
MPLERSEEGVWSIDCNEDDRTILEQSHPSYLEALPRYLAALDVAFERARSRSEFNFLWSIFAVRGMQDAGWDPYETTLRAVDAIRKAHNDLREEASQHLGLWLYGHIMEASEPYEFLGNLIDVAAGGRFSVERFPARQSGAPLSPSIKIERLEKEASAAGIPEVVTPMREAWNRDLRNSIFHADYSFHGSELRTIRPSCTYQHDELMTIINRALACHEAISILRKMHVQSYSKPVVIAVDPRFSHDPLETAIVIVREGYGAAGLKDGWTKDQIAAGHITFRVGRFSVEESKTLTTDHTLALLPPER